MRFLNSLQPYSYMPLIQPVADDGQQNQIDDDKGQVSDEKDHMAAADQPVRGTVVRKAPNAGKNVHTDDDQQHGKSGHEKTDGCFALQAGDFTDIEGEEEKHCKQDGVEHAAERAGQRYCAILPGQVIVGYVQHGSGYQRDNDCQEHTEGRGFPGIGKSDQCKHDKTDRNHDHIADRCVIVRDEMSIRWGHRITSTESLIQQKDNTIVILHDFSGNVKGFHSKQIPG